MEAGRPVTAFPTTRYAGAGLPRKGGCGAVPERLGRGEIIALLLYGFDIVVA